MISRYTKGLLQRVVSRVPERSRAGLAGLAWSSSGQFASLFLKLGCTLILTRLLAPEVYGILGTAMAVLTTLEWLSDLGVQPALIRHKRGDELRFLTTGWTINLGRGTVLSICAALSAVPLAMFYDEPSLCLVLIVLALRPVVMALRSPGYPLLRRNLNYRALFVDELTMTGVGSIVSISAAFFIPNVWAIVAGTMAGALASVVATYILCPIRPRICFDREAAEALYGLGRQVLINTLLMALWLNLDRLLGLRLLTPAEMGLYAIAFNLATVSEGLVTRICDVYFSMLAREQGDNQSIWHRQVCQHVARRGMPLGALGLVISPWVIWILYDSRYAGAGLIFAILMARVMLRAFGQLQFQYLLARAEVTISTCAYLLALAVQGVLLVPLSQRFGPVGMAFAALLSTATVTVTQAFLLNLRTGNGMRSASVTLIWTTAGLISVAAIYGVPQDRELLRPGGEQATVAPDTSSDGPTSQMEKTS